MLEVLRRITRYRTLLWTLTVRDLKARYRGSALGFLWSLVNPLLLLSVYTLVFGFIIGGRFTGADPYALFLICGLFPWVWISTSLMEGTLALEANSALIRKAAFPAELLPTVPVVANLLHFLLALPIVAVALGVGRAFGYPVGGGWGILILPLVILLTLPLVAGVTLALGALHVHFKDVRDMTQHALTLLFFLTPILYPLDAVLGRVPSALHWVFWLNPFTPYVLSFQHALFHGTAPPPGLWLQMALISLAAWGVGASLFDRLRDTLVEAA